MKHATPEHVKLFKEWLVDHGATILDTTNQYEVLRYQLNDKTGVAYMSESTRPNVSKPNIHCLTHWLTMMNSGEIEEIKKTKRDHMNGNKRKNVINKLKNRDGYNCWFCGTDFSHDNKPTIEHMVAVANGGPNHTSNYVLACKICNDRAGTLSVSEKVALRDKLTK